MAATSGDLIVTTYKRPMNYYFGTINDNYSFLQNIVWQQKDEGDHDEVWQTLTNNNKSLLLLDVARQIEKFYMGNTTEEIFNNIKTAHPKTWFANRFIDRCKGLDNFDFQRLEGHLFVRNVYKKESYPYGKLYIENGSHRSFVYMLKMICNCFDASITPISILWCKSWDHMTPDCSRAMGDDEADTPFMYTFFTEESKQRYFKLF